jgi:hypothetical protein
MPDKKATDDKQADDATAQAADAGEAGDDAAAGETGAGADVALNRTELERLRRKLWDRYHSGMSR